jgi:hypothetical protein
LAKLHHSHGADDWHDMVEVTPAHDAAEGDPEREWQHGRIFRCASCEEEIRVVVPETERPTAVNPNP